MELTDLKIFLCIAEEGSISRAAERLDYVQSNVTARLRKLEEELGTALFRRFSKGVALTEKGAVFREYALQIVTLSEEASRAVRDSDEPGGPLVIGVVETATCGRFMQMLSEFQLRYPAVELSFIAGQSSELSEKVLNYELDGAIIAGAPESPELDVEYQTQDELKWLMNPEPGALPDLSAVQWAVSPKGCPYRRALEAWLRDEGVSSVCMIELGSVDMLLSSVRSGLASTLLPASVLTGEYEKLGAWPVPEKYRYTTTSLVRRKSRFAHQAFQAFVDMVRTKGL